MKQQVQPAAVNRSQKESRNGIVSPDSRTALFIQLLGHMPAYMPLSGKTMEFDSDAHFVASCKFLQAPVKPAPKSDELVGMPH